MMPQSRQSMVHRQSRAGFTLIEVLVVVVILAILAGVTISRFMGTADDAKSSSLKHGLSVVQAQLEVYRAQHANQYPKVTDGALPQLTSATNATGQIGAAGPSYPFGPYLIEAPRNPYDGKTTITAVSLAGAKPTGVANALGGWQYDEATGAFWPNNPEYFK